MEKYDISSTDTAIENKVYEYAVDYTNEKGLLENIVVFHNLD